eukprot:SAG31_NODE_478_length_15144_cov_15.165769_2_plen_68_part_00
MVMGSPKLPADSTHLYWELGPNCPRMAIGWVGVCSICASCLRLGAVILPSTASHELGHGQSMKKLLT